MFPRSLRTWLFIAGATVVCASSVQGQEQTSPAAHPEDRQRTAASWRDSYLALGKETYSRTCASCHDQGTDGAPAIGDREAWSNRSPLWSAVLLEHAKSGYLGMPPKGGDNSLTERAVEAAGEYMLGETFPELLKD